MVKKTYKHKPIYLVAKENDEIKGVLPLFLMKSMIFGKKLVSVPFAPCGGACADNETIDAHPHISSDCKNRTTEYREEHRLRCN